VSSIDIKHNLAILYGSITFIGLFIESKKIQDISSRHANEVYTLKELQKVEEKKENNWWKEKDLQRNKPKPLYILNKDDPVVYLKNNTNQAEVYLIGSNHVSPESLKLIRNVIRKLRPDYVMVENTVKGYNFDIKFTKWFNLHLKSMMESTPYIDPNTPSDKYFHDNKDWFRSRQRDQENLLLATFNGIDTIGQDMPLALKEGRKVGARIVLGDKPDGLGWRKRRNLDDALDTNEALNEAYCSIYGYSDNMTLGECVHFMSKIGNSKEVNEIKSAIKNLDPKLYKNLYSNREEVMFNSLRYLKGIVVGVVGRDHLDAISKLWEEANEREKILNVSK
jgi:hypothetical protein